MCAKRPEKEEVLHVARQQGFKEIQCGWSTECWEEVARDGETDRQWLVLDALEVTFRSLECISRRKLLMDPDQRRGKPSEGFRSVRRDLLEPWTA